MKADAIPWRSIATSVCLWACLTAHVCNNWLNYTLLTTLPTFMKEVLKFNIKVVCSIMLSSMPVYQADSLNSTSIKCHYIYFVLALGKYKQ